MPTDTRTRIPTPDERLRGFKLALRQAPLVYERKLARLRAEILSIELGGAAAPVAAEAWHRVHDIDTSITATR